jgi:hypothetical protein
MRHMRQMAQRRLGAFQKAPDQRLHELAWADLAPALLPAAGRSMFGRAVGQHELQGLLQIGYPHHRHAVLSS